MPHEIVGVRSCPDQAELLQVVRRLTEDTGFKVPKGSRIVVKPNLNDLKGPNSGLTTDVRVVDALVQYLNAEWSPQKILIVESDSWNRRAEEAFEQLGYREIESAHQNVKLVNLTKASSIAVELPIPSYHRRMRIPRLFMENDYFISVAKLRTHYTIISGILKNQFGCVPRRYKGPYHPYLPNILSNLNLLLRPDWSMVDALVGADNVGPREVGLLLASCDPVALDSVSALMGFDPKKIPIIREASKNSVGEMDDVTVLFDGKPITDLGSLIPSKFIGPSRLGIAISSLAAELLRAADRTRVFSAKLQQFSAFSMAVNVYSKTELLKRMFRLGTLRIVYSSVRAGRPQEEL